jgi:nitrate reductase beta subunit
MLFYVPPLLPVLGRLGDDGEAYAHAADDPEDLFAPVGKARIPLAYLASLFSAGDVRTIERVMGRLLAVRYHLRARRAAGDGADGERARAARALAEADLTPEDADAIYRLTALATLEERYVLPPLHREESVGLRPDAAEACRQCCGLGTTRSPGRGE